MKNNNIYRKLLALLIVLAFSFSFAAQANGKVEKLPPKVLFYENFEGYGVKHFVEYGKDAWTGDSFHMNASAWSVDSRNFHIFEDDKERQSKVMRLGVSPGTNDRYDDGYIYKTVSINDSIGIRFQFKYEEELGIKRMGILTKAQYNLMTIEDNYLRDYNGRKLRKVQKDTWYDCAIILSKDGFYNLYINEARMTGSGVKLPREAAIGNSVSVYFGVHGINESYPEHVNNMLLDDILIYGGNKVLTQQEIKNLPTLKRYEHENQPNPLTDLEEKRADIKERTKNLIVFAIDNKKSMVLGEIKETPVARWENNRILIPAVYTAEVFGNTSTKSENAVSINGSWGTLNVNEDGSVYLNGVKADIFTEICDGIVYAQAETFAPLIGKVYSSTTRHIAVISSSEDAFSESDAEIGEDIVRDLLFQSPTSEEITQAFNKTGAQHPRIIASAEDFARVRELIKTDAKMKEMAKKFLTKADGYMETPHMRYWYENETQLLNQARAAENRLPNLALAYNITLDKKYADRAIAEMMTMVNFPGWQITNSLSNATMGYLVAICYDWLYDLLTPEQKAATEQAIYRFQLQPTLEGYRDPSLVWNMASHWVYEASNWTAVCNGSAMMSALAVFDKYPEDCAEIVASAYRSLTYYLMDYFPDGGSLEGLGYWAFAMRLFTPAVASSLISLGTDFEYPEAPGLCEAVEFPIALHGINAFGFHDSRNTPIDTQIDMWWARRLNRPEWGKIRVKKIDKGTFTPIFFDILWYDPQFANYHDVEMSLDRNFRFIETGSLRSTWSDDNGALVFFHGGESAVSHWQMDAGSLEMEMLGERWIWDLGTDDLTYQKVDGYQRQDVYRIRAEGNNSLVINPSTNGGQERDCYAFVEDMVSKERGSYVVLDITDCYRNQVDSYKRGYMLANDRRSIVIQDEVHAKAPSELFWSFNTRAQINMAEDGQSAVLTMKDKKIKVTFESDFAGAKMDVMPSVPLDTSPQLANAKNVGVKKLFVNIKDSKDATIKLTFSPIDENGNAFSEPITPMVQWSIPDGELQRGKLTSLKINGREFAEITDTRFDYNIMVNPTEKENIVFTYEVQDGYSVSESRNEDMYMLELSDRNGEKQTYSFHFVLKEPSETDNLIAHKVIAAEASEVPEAEHPPENVFDGDYSNESRWAANGEHWLILDLGESKQVDYAGLTLYNGGVRISNFEVYLSEDKTNWTEAGKFESNGIEGKMDYFKLKGSKARYVKFGLHGNSVNLWNSIIEAGAYQIGTEAK